MRDYLHADGSVCRGFELRADAAINGKLRPLYFSSSRLDDALAAYFRERLAGGHGLGEPDATVAWTRKAGYSFPERRGLQDHAQQWRAGAEPLRLPGAAGDLPQVVPLRRTQGSERPVGAPHRDSRMYERGADEDQVGAILGIGERSAVRELLPRPKPTLAELLDELI